MHIDRALSLFHAAPWRIRLAMLATGSFRRIRSSLSAAAEHIAVEAKNFGIAWAALCFPCELLSPIWGHLPIAASTHALVDPTAAAFASNPMAFQLLLIPMAISASLLIFAGFLLASAFIIAPPLRMLGWLLPAEISDASPAKALRSLISSAIPDDFSFSRWERRFISHGRAAPPPPPERKRPRL